MNFMVIKKFSCPTCNAGCGLLVEVNNNKILSVKPDPNYPLSGGFCCPKGIALGDITNDKDRILKPLIRSGNLFHEISWKKAIDLKGLKDREALWGRSWSGSSSSFSSSYSAGRRSSLL